MAERGSRPSELRARPGASAASSEHAATSDRATAAGRAKAVMTPTEGTASTNSWKRRTPRTRAISKMNSTATWTGIPAPIPDIFSSQQQVAARVGDIHQRLVSRVTADTGLETDFLSLAEEHPANVVMSLLRCAPSCDRAAVLMWRSIGTSRPAVQKVLPALFSVIEDRPLYSMFFYSGDNEAVFALAATVVLWKIAHMPEWHDAVVLHSAQLFVALLFQVFSTTEQIPEEVEDFWRACQEEHRLPTKPNRFAVQAVKALLCQLGFENKLVALECKQVWDTLLCADTQHYAVGLLAREMRRGLAPLCSRIALHLLSLLIRKQPRWHLPALAFLVELLECLDLSKHGHSALSVVSRHLPSECRDRLRLELRGLVVLSKEPLLSGGIRGLYQHLLEQLADPDAEMVGMILSVLTYMLQEKDLKIPGITALKLAEPLLPHFENESSHVQLLSIQLFSKVMELVVEEGKKPLTRIVSRSLLPLFFCWHNENRRVAKASLETLLCAARFLRRRDMEELLRKEQRMKFAEHLVRRAWKRQPRAGEAPWPRCSVARSGPCERRPSGSSVSHEPGVPPRLPARPAAAPPTLGAAAALPQPCPPSGGSVRQGPG
ncbi:maestro heat-like repeat family member 5 [Passer domesticus]|uniref:maestro heat-like repeat family member 5 n=1 Tax=Passer domesticus TaxID=48849 RepID=UPI0030FEB460